MLVLAFVTVLLCQGAFSSSTGAPAEACQNMTPIHGEAVPQLEPCPYWAELVRNTENDRKFELTINGDEINKVEGFMIQARDRSTGIPVGSFDELENEIIAIDCLGGTKNCATHAAASETRTNIAVTWNAPEGNPLTNINFVYTVVKAIDTFWVNQIEPLVIPPEGSSKKGI